MKRNIAYRYRAYPDQAQGILLQKTFGCARFIWNQMLADIKAYYEKEQKVVNSIGFTPCFHHVDDVSHRVWSKQWKQRYYQHRYQ